MDTLKLHFIGPYSFVAKDNMVFTCKQARSPGIYLWTIKTDKGNVMHYVGETTSFAKRQSEHMTHILGLNYGIFDVEAARKGIDKRLWKGMWRDKELNETMDLLEFYRTQNNQVLDYLGILNVFFAEYVGTNNARRHIEGSIAWHLRSKAQGYASLYPTDNHTGVMKNDTPIKLVITSDEPICGLASEIEI